MNIASSRRTPKHPTSEDSSNISRRIAVIIGALWLIVATGLAREPQDNASLHIASPISLRINPNLAPLWELTTLPRIGDTKAAAIIDYRKAMADSHDVSNFAQTYHKAEDLQHVRGIGPKTTARLEPYLRFDD